MENNDQLVIDKLNHLIHLTEDGKYGFENAAKDNGDQKLNKLFMQFADERTAYIKILSEQVHNLGGEITLASGGPLGSIHRTWMDFKSLVTGGDRDPILKACISGEEAAGRGYKAAIEASYIQGATMQIIAAQYAGIETVLATLKQHLKDESSN